MDTILFPLKAVIIMWWCKDVLSESVQNVTDQVLSRSPMSEKEENFANSEKLSINGNPGSVWVCYNYTTPQKTFEPECHCKGKNLLDIPSNLYQGVQRLTISDSGIVALRKKSLDRYRSSLKYFSIMNVQYLSFIEAGVFHNMPELLSIYISDAPSLIHIASDVFRTFLPKLKALYIDHTGLMEIPFLGEITLVSALHVINMENNHIQKLGSANVHVTTERMNLGYNKIEEVEARAFEKSKIAKLSLRGNVQLTTLHQDAFADINSLLSLDLSQTSITRLPTVGLENLETLIIENTFSLKVFPSVYKFSSIENAHLTYPYHCCAFKFPAQHDPTQFHKHKELQEKMKMYCGVENEKQENESSMNSKPRSRRSWGVVAPSNVSTGSSPKGRVTHTNTDEQFHQHVTKFEKVSKFCGNLSKNYKEVVCSPQPDAYNPCEDVMGNWALRVAVWFVTVAAILGNMAVLVVLLSSRFRMTVPKFLMCNLSMADLCMGLYLLLIAIMDARSIGDYFNYAIDWQNGVGCRIAGFLTIFASELSIFTLTVITSERWYTITYAIHLNKRLKLCTATKIMAVGWLYSAVMGTLPLIGVSSYSKTSICLPLKKEIVSDMAYLGTLLTFNGLAFFSICTCYGRMYYSIRQGQDAVATLARSDMRVAKRMALLVFTDFACWAPIAFFGLTALAGYPLIDVSNTKILLVFFYPLNSCANPYLYALLTQQYRRDMFILLSRYGLCAQRAARYKGTAGNVPRGFPPGNCAPIATGGNTAPQSGHRGSVLTSLTSIENVPIRTGPLSTVPEASQVEMVPAPSTIKNDIGTTHENNNKISSYL